MQQATFGKLVEPEWVGKPVNIRSMTSELKLNIEEKFPQ